MGKNTQTRQTSMVLEHGDVLRVSEVARLLNISQTLVLRLLRSGKLPGFQLGRCWLIPRPALLAYISSLATPSSEVNAG
jgi:excisionase family DNA binding protein